MRDLKGINSTKEKGVNLDMEKQNIDFQYTYSAKEQDEIRQIRQKYEAQEKDEMSRLREMDARVSQKATTSALVFGVLGALVMGSGMSLIMTDLSNVLGMNDFVTMCIGIVVGLLGMSLMALAYPTYIRVLKKEREKIAPEILKLTENLLK
ncbi:MAG: hypothetical protein IJA54_03270 [Tyzzerella sp.]|nr:hypothetical protein [Tyzzerella sp.]